MPKEEIIETSMVRYGDVLYEQVYNAEKKLSQFQGWDAKEEELILLPFIEQSPRKYIPINDDLLQKGAIILPSGATDYGTVEDLDLELNTFIEAWVDISPEHRKLATWYTFLTWVPDHLNTIPYLRALGDYGTGKTRYLDVIGSLCRKPMFVGGAVSPAPIYRIISLWRGTPIFDEFTLKKSDSSQDIIQILNNGYQRNKPVLRCASENFDKVNAFDPFGAKIIASRQSFNDRALESRCITEIMRMTPRTDVPIDLTSNFHKQIGNLQNKLLMYRFKNLDEIKPDESIHIDFGNILPRVRQSLVPFTALFQHDEKRLSDFIRYAQERNKFIVEENSDSFDGQIFNHYIKLIETHEQQTIDTEDFTAPVITSTDIRNAMVEDGWKEDKLNARVIGKHLSILGFKSAPTKIEGKTVRVLEIDDEILKSLKIRYVVT